MGLPFAGMGPIDGFLELYDDDIAIVTSLLSHADVIPLYLGRQDRDLPADTTVVAAGRQFMARTWMLQHETLLAPSEGDPKHLGFFDSEILEVGTVMISLSPFGPMEDLKWIIALEYDDRGLLLCQPCHITFVLEWSWRATSACR